MSDYAHITVKGNVGRVDELKYIGSSNTPVLKFSLANGCGYGEKKTTSWYACQFFGARAEKLAQFITKGKQLIVGGNPEIREWEANGKRGTSVEIRVSDITLLGGGKDDHGGQQEQTQAQPASDDGNIPF